jgi:hypothetical protein
MLTPLQASLTSVVARIPMEPQMQYTHAKHLTAAAGEIYIKLTLKIKSYTLEKREGSIY